MPSLSDGIPASFYIAQQACNFIQRRDFILHIGINQTCSHVLVEVIEVGSNLTTQLQIEPFTQTTNDADGLADQLTLEGSLSTLHCATRLGQTSQAAFHQHLNQPMRAGFNSLRLGVDARRY